MIDLFQFLSSCILTMYGLYKPFDSIHTTDDVEIPTFAKTFFGNIETNEKLLKFFKYIFKNILSYYEKT